MSKTYLHTRYQLDPSDRHRAGRAVSQRRQVRSLALLQYSRHMRTITQQEAESMRKALKEIASFGNPARNQLDPQQAAAKKARETLEQLGLFLP